VKKRNLKAIFLGLLGRRRAGDKSSPDRAAAAATQAAAAARSRIEPEPSDLKAISAHAETVSATSGHLPQKPPGPPADWLAKYSSGPPSHWVERVRSAAPQMSQDQGGNEFGATAVPQPPRQVQLGPTPRLQRPEQAPPLRLQRPGRAPGADEPSRSAHDRRTIGRVPQISAGAGRATESPQISPRLHLKSDRAMAPDPPSPKDRGRAIPMSPPPDNASRSARMEPSSPARADSSRPVQSTYNSDGHGFPRVEPVGAGMTRSSGKHEAPLHIPIISAAPAQVVKFSWPGNREQENVARKNITRYPDVIRHEAPRLPVSDERPIFKSGYRPVMKREEAVTNPVGPHVTQERRDTSHEAPAGRWPMLLEAAPADHFDDLMAVLRELRHNQRLVREQEGALWNE
jgi:hypothetical protein